MATVRSATAEPTRHHAAYVDILGKGALWGLGYDYQVGRWASVGAVGSFFVLRGDRVMSLSPYLGAYPVGRGRHRLLVHAGPQLVRRHTPSPVPEWPGDIDEGVAAEVSIGYEYRSTLLVRAYGMVTAGSGGVFPWLGASIGWAR